MMSDEREIRPGETLEWVVDEFRRRTVKFGWVYDDDDIMYHLAREALRYRREGVVPARWVDCHACGGTGEVRFTYSEVICPCRECNDGKNLEEVRDETDR